MGWISAVAQVARELVSLPQPIPLQFQPSMTFDTAPQPVDRVIMAAKAGSYTSVSRELALSVPAVQRGRNELCGQISTLPLRLYRGTEILNSPLFRQFDPDVPNVVHMSMTVEDLAFEGIAWWQVTGQDFEGYPVSVRRIAPGRVSLNDPRTGKPDRRYVWITPVDGGQPEPISTELMIRFDSPNPGVLKAMARAVRIAVQLDKLTEMYANNPALREYFTDADNPEEDGLDDDEIDAFLAEYGAMRQTRPYGWIPSTVKRADVSAPSPKDLTLVELQERVNLAIANGLGVDPEDLGVSTTSRTYQNSVDRKQDKINRVYGPYMAAITDRLSMGDVTRYGQLTRFDLTDYLKSDPVTQAGYWKTLEELGVTDAAEIRGWAGLSGPPPTAPAAAPPVAAAGQSRALAGRHFDGEPVMRFSAQDFAAADVPAPTVDTAARTITGLAVPYNAVANKYGMKYAFRPGSLEYSEPARMAHLKDHMTPVGFHRSVKDTPDGPIVELAVLDGPEGSPAKYERDQLLYDAEHGLYSGLSVGVDFDLDPESGDVEFNEQTGVWEVVRATWRETSSTYMPAFDDARVTKVAASLTGDPMFCTHCGQRHAPNIACATFARQLAPATQPVPPGQPAPDPAPGQPAPNPAPAPSPEFIAQVQAAFAAGQPPAANGGPSPVSPHHGPAQVTEEQPYRFDRRGNLGAGSHDFSTDIIAGWRDGDMAARQRAEGFLQEQFAVTPANVAALNPNRNRPDLYVDQMDYQFPMYDAVFKGTLEDATPFVIPKFSSSSGLVADHVSGTEPTPGAFAATTQTLTPTAVSGKVEVLREALDQGGNPQMSGLIWKQMTRAYYEALEAYVQAQLTALAASITDITITTAAVDGALDAAISSALVPLQYVRGGDRFRRVFTQIDLYKAMVAAKDTTGRRLYPTLGPVNTNGQTSDGYSSIDAHGKLWIPSWATAATGSVAATSWMFDPDKVCLWASAPRQINLEWRVAWVDIGIWGYKAFGVTDFNGVRELVYDPV
jgi:Phage portal protein